MYVFGYRRLGSRERDRGGPGQSLSVFAFEGGVPTREYDKFQPLRDSFHRFEIVRVYDDPLIVASFDPDCNSPVSNQLRRG
jgi:hypothetical protein